MIRVEINSLWISMLLAACSDGSMSQENTNAVSPTNTISVRAPDLVLSEKLEQKLEGAQNPMNDTSALGEFKAFVAADKKILASQAGDLNTDGLQDAILILDGAKTSRQKLGEGDPRTLLLLIRHPDGHFVEAARNSKIVPCASCGGLVGDPFGYVRVDKGGFIVSIEGGSRERWSSEYTFRFASDKKQWLLETAEHSVIDTMTGHDNRQKLTNSDFGAIPIDTFDPSTLPFPDSG